MLLKRTLFILIATSAISLSGCKTIPAYQQQHVSKAGMTFSDNPTESDRVNLLSQTESGSAVSGGGQAAGCTACR